ncbi:flagellar hook-basal body protein [Puniceicoccaceae bacterium K14]|nr:flagellar hook-basal body protein [Puniceicoccaceae bacterium K14]
MLNGVYQNAAAMTGLESWNNGIAQNLSQSMAPGYKQASVSFEGKTTGLMAYQSANGKAGFAESVTATSQATTDFTQGTLRHTGDAFEFALEEEGFFELRRPDGELVYTRDGQFHVNNEGELVSKQGYHVMSDTRNEITLIPDGGELSGELDGTLKQNGQTIGKIGVQVAADPSQLVRSHGGFALPEDSDMELYQTESKIRQGYLESSNVSATKEMVNLINVSRSFQLNQRAISNHDDLLGKAIRSLGGNT